MADLHRLPPECRESLVHLYACFIRQAEHRDGQRSQTACFRIMVNSLCDGLKFHKAPSVAGPMPIIAWAMIRFYSEHPGFLVESKPSGLLFGPLSNLLLGSRMFCSPGLKRRRSFLRGLKKPALAREAQRQGDRLTRDPLDRHHSHIGFHMGITLRALLKSNSQIHVRLVYQYYWP